MNKLLILDMDGVINSDHLIREWYSKKILELEGASYSNVALEARKLFNLEFKNCTELVFPELAERIKKIVDETNCKIVWSSTWRIIPNYSDIELAKSMFDRRGLPGDALIGYTPDLKNKYRDNSIPRGREIRHYAEHCGFEILKAAVIDDDHRAGIDLPNNFKFFMTKEEHGITKEIMNEIIEYLS